MLNVVYRLVAPRRIEIAYLDINAFGSDVIVRPTHLSICKADQRYYQGTRDPDVLAKKLPMALIHEGIGEVVYDPTSTFKPGDCVVMIPNTPVETDEVIGENYLQSSKFRASGFDGFLQENIQISPDRLVLLPKNINRDVASFTELASVSIHAISRFERFSHSRKDAIGIWGDGNLGYVTALFLKALYPESKIYVFGVNIEKLNYFSFVDECFLTTKIPNDLHIDHAFECVVGSVTHIAINQIIDLINPEGTISILGVSEYPVPINTRMILEKGLRIFGSSRSGREDFVKTVELYQSNPEICIFLENLVSCKKVVRNLEDIYEAFDEDNIKTFGKTIIKWEK
jgi:Threonine dehydrogenase and related Zn-dependent dehydrogenases